MPAKIQSDNAIFFGKFLRDARTAPVEVGVDRESVDQDDRFALPFVEISNAHARGIEKRSFDLVRHVKVNECDSPDR